MLFSSLAEKCLEDLVLVFRSFSLSAVRGLFCSTSLYGGSYKHDTVEVSADFMFYILRMSCSAFWRENLYLLQKY